ncbi:MAG: RraA family protein [Nocardioides sp.]
MDTSTWPAGFLIRDRVPGPDPTLLAELDGIPAAYVSDAMGKATGGVGLHAYGGPQIMCGPAITVRVRPGDNLMVHKSFDLAQAGDVIVVDAGGDLAQAIIGGNMRATMRRKGIAGIVIDGAIRDLDEFAEGGFPAFAKGICHRGPSKDGPGEINVPIACAGMVVHPGDIVIGDSDGVVTVQQADLPALVSAVKDVVHREETLRHAIENDATDPERFDSILRAKGCPV